MREGRREEDLREALRLWRRSSIMMHSRRYEKERGRRGESREEGGGRREEGGGRREETGERREEGD